MSERFNYVKYDEKSIKQQAEIKGAFQEAEKIIDQVLIGESRAKALAMTHLEIAYMWTGKAIRDEQNGRGETTDIPERNNS